MDIKVLLNKKVKGSITVEAAFSFTLTIFILFMMIGPLFVIKTSSDILIKMNEATIARANYEMVKSVLGDNGQMSDISKYSDDDNISDENVNLIEDVVNYIVLAFDFTSEYKNIDSIYENSVSNYDKNTGIVKYDYTFDFKLPYNVLNVKKPRERFVMYRRAFIGAETDRFAKFGESDDYIYLASNFMSSHIYHNNISCSYLIKKTYTYTYDQIGEKYTKCDYCFRDIIITNSTQCFVTEYGDRFHYKDNCPVMTAYVTKAPKDYIDRYGLTLCSRCEKKESKSD